jgi:exodeoxyribonuclease VII large subunit
VADEAAAISMKTPTAAAEWIVARVADYSGRLDAARHAIRNEARGARARAVAHLEFRASQLSEGRGTLSRQIDLLSQLRAGIADAARTGLRRQRESLRSYDEVLAAIGVEPTLRRGFALVILGDGSVARSVNSLEEGDRVRVRLVDGEVGMTVGSP